MIRKHRPEPAVGAPRRRVARGAAAAAAAGLLVAASAGILATEHHATSASKSRLISSSCSGPAGAAYVSDTGWDGFSAVNTANCSVIQVYNVGDTEVQGFPDDQNYSSTNEGEVLYGSNLYFALAGTDSVGVVDTSTLNASNYNPSDTLIHVGFNPEELAVSPGGQQLWVADTGPQTSTASPSGISVINLATDSVVKHFRVGGNPYELAFAGNDVFVATSRGLAIYNATTYRPVGLIRSLSGAHGVVAAPDGNHVYVTDATNGTLVSVSTATDQVVGSVHVGMLPWQAVVSSDGSTIYVANADSDSISVVNAAALTVTDTITPVGQDPDALALTPDGSELWVCDEASGAASVIDTATNTVTSTFTLGYSGPNSGDGYGPNSIVLTTTPTAGS